MPIKCTLKSILSILILSIGVVSCDNKEKASLVNPGMAPSAQPIQQAAPATGNAVQSQPSGSTARLNPKHGDPGHRCDLPVGAPLNGSTANSAPIMSTQQPAASQRLNPKHGDPGHRCDLPVGAPL
jgi:hypothetical protein